MSRRDLTVESARDGFTPGRKDLPELCERLVNAALDEQAKLFERALLRGPHELVFKLAAEKLPRAQRPGRARLVALVARLTLSAEAAAQRQQLLLGLVFDGDLKAANAAIAALGACEDDQQVESVLLACLAQARVDQRRGLVRSLGKLGGQATLAALSALDVGDDEELGRLVAQAKLL